MFADREEALADSEADLIYVSTVNSEHSVWVERALESGKHVVVDKPAFTELRQAERLVTRARQLDLCLAEATVYAYHPQIERARRLFDEAGQMPAKIVAVFSFPPLPPGDFRYRRDLGGGALLDLGAYAMTPGRVFFGETPLACHVTVESRHDVDPVETSFSVLASYAGGRSVVGHFGFTTEYRNQLTLLGRELCVDIGRVFTTPPDYSNEMFISRRNESSSIRIPPADSFALFLEGVINSIDAGRQGPYLDDLEADARALAMLRHSATEAQR